MQKSILGQKAKKDGEKPPSMSSIKYGKGGGLPILRANRSVANLIEQTIPFLLGIWLHCVFVDPLAAARLGWLWIAVRGFYPFVFGKGPLLFAVTLPNYVCIFLMFKPFMGTVF